MSVYEEQENTNVFGQPTPVAEPTKPLTPTEQMAKIREEMIERLYKNDPLIREGIQTQLAVEEARGPTPTKESNVVFDENGRVIGTKVSPMSGGNAEELMRKIRESYNKTKGEES